MYRGPSKQFKVVRSGAEAYAVWHADAAANSHWSEVGYYGTWDECRDYITANRSLARQAHPFKLATAAA